MKQKLLSFILMLCVGISAAYAYDFSVVNLFGQRLYYNINSGTTTVSVTYPDSYGWGSYTKPTGNLTIPTTVTYGGTTYSVTSIGNNAFLYCNGLTSVTIPNSVTSIGNNAFLDCSGLTSVTIPNSVTSIGDAVFAYCSSLTSVTIPNSVTSIGYSAFYDCSGLTSVTIPNSVTFIGNVAFGRCSGLNSIVVSSGNAVYDSRGNCNAIIHTATNTLVVGCSNTIIPNTVTTIGDGSFESCIGLTSITIPNSVTFIGESAFSWCIGLTSLTIPNSVTFIGYEAFGNCSGLTSVTIPNSITSIENATFRNCSSLKFISIPNSVTSIGDEAFWGCDSLIYISIPNSVKSIGNYAFEVCRSLRTISIEDSVTSIGDGAFKDCTGLTTVFFNAYRCTKSGSFYHVNHEEFGWPFQGCQNISTFYIGGNVTIIPDFLCCRLTGLTSVTIPNLVTSIGNSSFLDCSGLTSVTIGNSVTSIGDWAFAECSGLTSVTIDSSVTTIGFGAFSGCRGLTSLTIPNSVTTIGEDAFHGCSGLTSLTIPNSVTSIGIGAFFNCSGLTSMVVSSGNTVYDSRGNCNAIIRSSSGTLLFGCQKTTIPNSVTSIVDFAFIGCSGLTSLTIPNSVTSIGFGAFENCSGLTSITAQRAVAPRLGYVPFYNVPSTIPVYIPCGSYASYSSTWDYFSNFIEVPVFINVSSADSTMGSATVVTYPTCTSPIATISATPNAGYTFTNWTEDSTVVSTDATYTFSVTADRTLTAHFAPAVPCGIAATDLPYTDNFDSYTTSTTAKTGVQPDCWTLAHQDVVMADEYKPMIYYNASNAHSGSYTLILNKRGIYSMPEFEGDVNTLQLSFYLKQTQTKYQLQVGVMSDLANASTFVPIAIFNNTSTTASVLRTVDFSSYTGNGKYIAFRNILASGQTGDFSLNYIDDLTLDVRSQQCGIAIADLPYTDNFDSYTTSTTAKTGVQPPCWTLAHQDVNITDAYKPMIYYNASNAHSGSYTLILNKRGIYTMPEFEGDVNTLQLSFYLKQTQAKYQLQVGVMSDLSDASTFVPIATINNTSTTASVLRTVDFSSYTGTGHYIAFRNILASGQTGDYSLNYIDDLTLSLNCGISVADLPYIDNFDSYTSSTTAKTGVQPSCWTLAKQDVAMADEYKPMIYYNAANAHSGSYTLILNKRGIYAMPEFEGDVNTLQLSFYLKQPQTKYQLQVGVLNSLNNPDSFTPVTTINNSTTASILIAIDFSAYTGTGHYIAFRNILASGQTGDYSLNYIDDLTLELRPSGCTGINVADLPYTDNFDHYTTTTTAKTGIEPPCWTLAKQDVAMADEYKPMIYYNSSNAHSGSYSLILNKRGIYAMPEFSGDVNTLQLSFYLKQPQTKYQLQVGVLNSLNNPDSFTPVTTINNSSTASELVMVDFGDYTGSGHFVAFRNILAPGNTGDYSLNYIDDLRLETRCSIYPDELPYTDNFDGYTASITAKTGVAPDCWTLAHQDVAMTDEYKPMIYYNTSCAHSSSYSLMLNKRGIYAMPAYEGDVRDLQLSFYVRQTQVKYQLQVGVMTDLSNASTFVPVATFNNTSTTTSVLRTVNFASYTGNGHYIAFRNILASGQTGDYSCNYIDDLTLSVAGAKGAMSDENYGIAGSNELAVYPNPTIGMLTVEADKEVERVEVYDYTGRCVVTYEKQTTIDLSRLATGIYTLRVTLPERIEVRRVVKQ